MTIKLRWKKLTNGDKSAYLDIYHDGERNYEFLKIYIRTSDSTQIKKEKRQLVDTIKAKRELSLQASGYDYTPMSQKNADFIKYFERYLSNYSKADIRKVRYSLSKFKLFTKDKKITFKLVTPRLCEGV